MRVQRAADLESHGKLLLHRSRSRGGTEDPSGEGDYSMILSSVHLARPREVVAGTRRRPASNRDSQQVPGPRTTESEVYPLQRAAMIRPRRSIFPKRTEAEAPTRLSDMTNPKRETTASERIPAGPAGVLLHPLSWTAERVPPHSRQRKRDGNPVRPSGATTRPCWSPRRRTACCGAML